MSNGVKALWNKDASGEVEGWYMPNNPERFAVVEEVKKNPEKGFPAAVYPLLKKYPGDLRGKRVLVPSSGDNTAAFGFHFLGAKVTSCDIAENQLKVAKSIADKFGCDIEFICSDSMKLDEIKDGEYDLVYTSNGVHVWIHDLAGMYGNFYRVLKRGGYNLFFETHPVSRPFDDALQIKKPYEDIINHDKETVPVYEWRTQDIVNAVADAGFVIRQMAEFHSVPEDLTGNYLQGPDDPNDPDYGKDMYDWRVNPRAALPQCLCLCSQKI